MALLVVPGCELNAEQSRSLTRLGICRTRWPRSEESLAIAFSLPIPPPISGGSERIVSVAAEPTSSVTLDRLTRLAGRVLDVPVVSVSLVDADRRLSTSSYGLSAPIALLVFWSFMKQVIASDGPLVVTDGRKHRLAARNPAVRDGTVTAYVGMPLVTSDGRAVGTLSVMDQRPRRWSARQIELLREFSALIVGETASVQRHSTSVSAPATPTRGSLPSPSRFR